MTLVTDVVLVLNAGSSSIKFTLFDTHGEGPPLLLRGQVESLYTSPRFTAKDAQGAEVAAKSWGDGTKLGHDGALTHAQATCEKAKLNRSMTCRGDGRNNFIERVQDWFPSVDLPRLSEIFPQPQAEIG